jgi:hypothetical protein
MVGQLAQLIEFRQEGIGEYRLGRVRWLKRSRGWDGDRAIWKPLYVLNFSSLTLIDMLHASSAGIGVELWEYDDFLSTEPGNPPAFIPIGSIKGHVSRSVVTIRTGKLWATIALRTVSSTLNS